MQNEQKKLAAFLRRYKRFLTISSAAIVFISFTVREELSEYLKDRLAVFGSVDAQIAKIAENSFGGAFLLDQKLTRVIALLQRMNKMPDQEWREIIWEQPQLEQNLIDEQMADVMAVERISSRAEYYKANVRRIFDDRRKPLDRLVVISHGPGLTPEKQNDLREINKQLAARGASS